MKAIGELKIKKIVYCELCNQPLTRNLSIKIFNQTDEEIEKAKLILTEKANKQYICKICKSILKTNS